MAVAAGPSAWSGLVWVTVAVMAVTVVCGVSGQHLYQQTGGDDTSLEYEPRQGSLGVGSSPSLHPSWAQLLHGYNTPTLPLQHSPNTLRSGPPPHALPFSSLYNTLGATPLNTLLSQRLFGSPFTSLGAGLGNTWVTGDPRLTGILPAGVDNVGAIGQFGGGHLGTSSAGVPFTLHPLMPHTPPTYNHNHNNNLAQLIHLASLLPGELKPHHIKSPATRLHLSGTWSHRPRHPPPINRVLSPLFSVQERPSSVQADSRSPNRSSSHRATTSHHVFRSPTTTRPQESLGPLHPLHHPFQSTSLHPLPLAPATHQPTHHDGFKFPLK